jgi:signal peptidase I
MRKSTMKAWAKDIGISVLVAVIILQFIRPTIVKEFSMMNTLQENDYLIVSKQAYLFSEPKYGDIVVFDTALKTSDGQMKRLIKRVIGLPGDVIDIADGKVFRNGELLKEDYIVEPFTSGAIDSLAVPEGKLFVMGDNRQNSADSRDERIGLVNRSDIYGEAVIRLYPFGQIGLLK